MIQFIYLLSLMLLVKPSYQDGLHSMASLVLEKGFPLEEHNVVTDDGYILTVFRIPHGRNSTTVGKPLILMHGILCCSAAWVLGDPQESLGFLLADRGYDVWLPNSRGTTYSQRHVVLDPVKDKKEFWDFSFHEMGYYDMPATIDYILNATGEEQLYYVGHSQGTTQFFVMASARPEYNAKVRHMSALAPVAFMEHTKGGIAVLSHVAPLLEQLTKLFGIYSVLENNFWMQLFESAACRSVATVSPLLCSDLLFLITGYDSVELNEALVPLYTQYTPAGASVKEFMHYVQQIKNGGKFAYYDYGSGNEMRYKQSTPPEYDLSKITTPVMLHFSANDWIAQIEDVDKLSRALPNMEMRLVPFSKFNHVDFMWAMHAKELVYDDLLNNMSKY